MDTREIAAEYRLSHWAEIIRESQASAKSNKEYCKESGIRESVYYYWQRKLREEAISVQNKIVTDGKSLVPNGWAVCETVLNETKDSSVVIEIGKFRIKATDNSTQELLARVCGALASLC